MIILGIDPAYSTKNPCGFAALNTTYPAETWVIYAGVLTFAARTPPEERMRAVWRRTSDLLDESGARLIACEGAYQGKNPQTTIGLARLIGGIERIADERGLPFVAVAETQQRSIVQTYYPVMIAGWVGELPTAHQGHAVDAIAIAQWAAGRAAQRRAA